MLVMAAALWVAMGPQAQWLQAGWQWKAGMLAGLVALGSSVYAACLLALGFRPRDFAMRSAA